MLLVRIARGSAARELAGGVQIARQAQSVETCTRRVRLGDNEERAMAVHTSTSRDGILKALRESRALLNAFGVARVSLFGSFARDEGREDSDVDLLVEFNRPIGLFEFVRLQRRLGELIGHRVDLVTPAALKPQLRDRILHEAVVAA